MPTLSGKHLRVANVSRGGATNARFLGRSNPAGLFTNISSGVADFFIQPYDSVMMNGNKDLGVGIARGAGSLAKKTVFGFSDSLAKISGSIGKGAHHLSRLRPRKELWVLTMPSSAFRSVGRDVGQAVPEPASNPAVPQQAEARAVRSHRRGDFTRHERRQWLRGTGHQAPRGRRNGRSSRFLQGCRHGPRRVRLAASKSSVRCSDAIRPCRAVTKPAVGIFDFANNVTEGTSRSLLAFSSFLAEADPIHPPGIRNTTTVFDVSGIDRVRLPRFTASDGVLRVRFNQSPPMPPQTT